MKAIRYHEYGSPEVLELEDADMPAVNDEDVLIRVTAAAVNPVDQHFMRGTPYFLRLQGGLRRPKDSGLGADMAGCVEAVGNRVTMFAPGDEVFGCLGLAGLGSLAEYVSVRQDAVVLPSRPI